MKAGKVDYSNAVEYAIQQLPLVNFQSVRVVNFRSAPTGKVFHSTISIGVSDSTHAGLEFIILLAAADQAMYRAKQEGRNRVVMHSLCLSQVTAELNL